MTGKMETLRAQVKPEKAELVRKVAMDRFGYTKGAISKAVNVALDEWLSSHSKRKKPDWSKLRGALSDVKLNSVELQHRAWDRDW